MFFMHENVLRQENHILRTNIPALDSGETTTPDYSQIIIPQNATTKINVKFILINGRIIYKPIYNKVVLMGFAKRCSR